MKSLTICFITSRKEPKIEWFFDSLSLQEMEEIPDIIIVDHFRKERDNSEEIDKFLIPFLRNHPKLLAPSVRAVEPKPCIWQGEHRITSTDWWAKSNAMNTAIILCRSEFIAMVDDRCVLVPEWLQCVKDAMEGNYAVVGSYEKRARMKVENGVITDMGEDLGQDTRTQHGEPVPTRDWYGGSCALPLEWCLQVNGFSEDLCDGLGSEDSMFGITLRNSNFPMKFDSRMRIIEDRTQSEIGGALKRADKGVDLGTRAKSWAIVKAFHQKTSSQNSFDIRQHRNRVHINKEDLWSIMPSASHIDWYDQQPISEMT